MGHDRQFIEEVQQRFTIFEPGAAKPLRELSEREIVNLLDAIEDGHANEDEIASDMNLPLDTVTEIYDLWVETYDPQPRAAVEEPSEEAE